MFLKMKNGFLKDRKRYGSISPTEFEQFNRLIQKLNINTICNSALCPNRPECFLKKKTVTFLILGKRCTRSCKFCGVSQGLPEKIDREEPSNITKAVSILKLKYVVITSVTRDDLPDGGASQFVETIKKVRELNPETEIEVLIPDFKGNVRAIDKIIKCNPKVINHNIECCNQYFGELRPDGNYKKSLKILNYINNKGIITKSGFMVGVGESIEDIKNTLKDLEKNNVDIVTIGQYLPPTKDAFYMKKMYEDEEFDEIKEYALRLNFKKVFVGHNVRSSYHAETQLN